MMVYLKVSDYIDINNFRATPNNSYFQFFYKNVTQLSLLKVLHKFQDISYAMKSRFLFE